jgi:hypothetical protein
MHRLFSSLAKSFLCLAAVVLFAPVVVAEQIVITLDSVVPGPACNTPWFEAGCELIFLPTTTQDCIVAGQLGYCYPQFLSIGLGTGVGVAPARMRVDFGTIQGVQSVQLLIYEAHEVGCTRAFLYDGSTLVNSAASTQEGGGNHWLTLDAAGAEVDHLFVSGHEGYVWEIRLVGDTLVSSEIASWGAVKSLY